MVRRRRQTRRRRTRKQRGGNMVMPGHAKQVMVDLVIARYMENLDWLSKYKDHSFRRVIIYNKGAPIRCPDMKGLCEVKELPNVGFCDHSYLYHIVHEYNDLADITVFLPGSANLPNKKKYGEKIIDLAFKGQPALFGLRVKGLYENMQNFALDSSTLSDPLNQVTGKAYLLHPASPRPYGAWLKKYLPTQLGCPYVTYKGLHSFSKEMLHSHHIDFYKPFLNQLSHHRFPEVAHYTERTLAALVYPFPDAFFHEIPEKELFGNQLSA